MSIQNRNINHTKQFPVSVLEFIREIIQRPGTDHEKIKLIDDFIKPYLDNKVNPPLDAQAFDPRDISDNIR